MNADNELTRALNELTRALGRIEGELMEIRKLSERVSRLEQWQSWLKGGWAVLAAASAYLFKGAYGEIGTFRVMNRRGVAKA